MLEDIKGDKCYEVLDDDNYVLLYFWSVMVWTMSTSIT